DVSASGGAVFNVGSSSTDNGNNSGLIFNSCANVDLTETVPPTIQELPDVVFDYCSGTEYYWTITAFDNCGIDTTYSTPESGSFFPIGTTTVYYTATDNSGNSITKSFNITIRDPFAVSLDIAEAPYTTCAFGTNANIIIGYGSEPDSILLSPAYLIGEGSYGYWYPSDYLSDPYSLNPVFTPPVSSAGCSAYTYTLVVFDLYTGCPDTISVTINVVDVTTTNPNKVLMCVNGNNHSVPLNLVPNRLAQGHCLGSCSNSCSSFSRIAANPNEEEITDAGDVQVMPNPNNGVFAVNITPAEKQAPCVIQIYDLTGKLVHTQTLPGSEMINTSVDLSPFGVGIYMLRVSNGDFGYAQKVIVTGN
ncbi:MAG: T9SS type A sorting domain-containing protein, partial [Bacteroidia bacterium]